MSRKLQAEVEKLTKDIHAGLEAYDARWRDLCDFNRSQKGLKERMWEEARREQVRGKKHAVRTATLELLDFKHVCDSKSRMEADLEAALRRLHRLKQQLGECLCLPELRQQANDIKSLRKQIELRYKRGRVFYCQGHSSDGRRRDNSSSGLDPAAEQQAEWVQGYLDKLRSQTTAWETELEQLVDATDSDALSRKCQLETFLELHKIHLAKLSALLDAILSNDYYIPSSLEDELKDHLHMYLESNDALEYVVADEIYSGLDISETEDNDQDTEDDASDMSDYEDEANVTSPVGASPEPPSILPVDNPVVVAAEKKVTPAPNLASTTSGTSLTRRSSKSGLSSPVETQAATTAPGSEKQPAPLSAATVDVAVCDWDDSSDERTISVKRGDILYIVKVDASGWCFVFKDNRSQAGWVPNIVRKSVQEQEAQRQVSLLQRIEELERQEAERSALTLQWLLQAVVDSAVRPQSIYTVQWDWSQDWQPAAASRRIRYLDVSKGEKVWVLRLASDWVQVRKLEDWSAQPGWFPVAHLLPPEEVVQSLLLLDCISAPVVPVSS